MRLSINFKISTHALREEGDGRSVRASSSRSRFLPTPSARRATSGGRHYHPQRTISTHALREEGDTCGILVVS